MSSLPTPLILIGTAETLPPLAAQFRLTPELPEPIGAVLVGPGRPRDVRILGHLADLAHVQRTFGVRGGVVSLSESMRTERQSVIAQLQELGIQPFASTPLADQLADAAAVTSGPAPLQPTIRWEELINRRPHEIDRRAVAAVLENKCVVITGAGGSIGSELARIAAAFRPSLLVLMERSENALFEIDRQIARRFPGVARRAVLHDIVDAEATMRRMREFRPQAIFHAAAHKHVPLMEEHPADAVTNNLFGTKSVADAALEAGAERFVLISSDKAVNPTSVMGATKRLAEVYVQGLQRHAAERGAGTRFSMVRFGNVLGSAGSVIPVWSAQMSEGGPVTVTDPRMTRYFMTIPEAAALVIQASALTCRGDEAPVYVLDMGEPVRILDLAARFVAAHGFEPRVLAPAGGLAADVEWPRPLRLGPGKAPMDIVLMGIRPGEKLYEQLAYDSEQLRPTPFAGINAWAGEGGETEIHRMTEELERVRGCPDHAPVLRAIRRYVPEMVDRPVTKLAS